MERSRAILRIYPCCGDNHIVRGDDLFNLAIPIAGILAVGSYKFFDREMFVRAMPIHIGIGVEIFSEFRLLSVRERQTKTVVCLLISFSFICLLNLTVIVLQQIFHPTTEDLC